MALLVIFELEGATQREAEDWGELIIDACRLEPKIVMELHPVKDIDHISQTTAQDIFNI